MLTCPDAERSVLGSLLLLGKGELPPGLEPHHMHYQKHEFLYALIQSLHEGGRGYDAPCVLRASVARFPKDLSEEQFTERQGKVRLFLDLLVGEGQVSMLRDHARLVVEASCFRCLKARSLEMQDAALRGDAGALGRSLEAAHAVFGELVKLGGGPVLEVVKEEKAA